MSPPSLSTATRHHSQDVKRRGFWDALSTVLALGSIAGAVRLFAWGIESSSNAILIVLAVGSMALIMTGGSLAFGCHRAAAQNHLGPPA